MAKLVKSGENKWKVLENNSIIGGTVTEYIYGIGGNVVGAKMVGGTRPTKDEEMLELGTVYLDVDGESMFIPETESGVEHTSGHLREIADLMDDLRG